MQAYQPIVAHTVDFDRPLASDNGRPENNISVLTSVARLARKRQASLSSFSEISQDLIPKRRSSAPSVTYTVRTEATSIILEDDRHLTVNDKPTSSSLAASSRQSTSSSDEESSKHRPRCGDHSVGPSASTSSVLTSTLGRVGEQFADSPIPEPPTPLHELFQDDVGPDERGRLQGRGGNERIRTDDPTLRGRPKVRDEMGSVSRTPAPLKRKHCRSFDSVSCLNKSSQISAGLAILSSSMTRQFCNHPSRFVANILGSYTIQGALVNTVSGWNRFILYNIVWREFVRRNGFVDTVAGILRESRLLWLPLNILLGLDMHKLAFDAMIYTLSLRLLFTDAMSSPGE